MYPPRSYTGGNPNFQEMPRQQPPQQPTNPSGGADGMRVPQMPSIPGGMAGGMTGMPPWNNHQHQMYPPGSGFGASGRPNTGETWGGHPGAGTGQYPMQSQQFQIGANGNALPQPAQAAPPPIQGQTPTNPVNSAQMPPWAQPRKQWQWGQQGTPQAFAAPAPPPPPPPPPPPEG